MNERQKRFVEHFVKCGNMTEAARLAGYAQPAMQGSRLMKNDEILAAMLETSNKVSDALIADAKERQQFWTAIMRGSDNPEMKDRLKASELLGRASGDFLERHEHSGPGGAPLTVTVVYGRGGR